MELTTGTVMFVSGILLAAVSAASLFIQAVTASGSRKRIREKMQEKYSGLKGKDDGSE